MRRQILALVRTGRVFAHVSTPNRASEAERFFDLGARYLSQIYGERSGAVQRFKRLVNDAVLVRNLASRGIVEKEVIPSGCLDLIDKVALRRALRILLDLAEGLRSGSIKGTLSVTSFGGDFPKPGETGKPKRSPKPKLKRHKHHLGQSPDPGNAKKVDRFLRKCNALSPTRIFKRHIWRCAGYTQAREFEYWQKGDPKATTTAQLNFERILKQGAEKFVKDLERKRLLPTT